MRSIPLIIALLLLSACGNVNPLAAKDVEEIGWDVREEFRQNADLEAMLDICSDYWAEERPITDTDHIETCSYAGKEVAAFLTRTTGLGTIEYKHVTIPALWYGYQVARGKEYDPEENKGKWR